MKTVDKVNAVVLFGKSCSTRTVSHLMKLGGDGEMVLKIDKFFYVVSYEICNLEINKKMLNIFLKQSKPGLSLRDASLNFMKKFCSVQIKQVPLS